MKAKKFQDNWYTLTGLVSQGFFEWVDFFTAETLLKNYPEANQKHALFIAYLSMTMRKGFLCVQVEDSLIEPSPQFFSESPLDPTLLSTLCEGALSLPSKDLSPLASDALTLPEISKQELLPSGVVVKQGRCYYLRRTWELERYFKHSLDRLLHEKPTPFPEEVDLGAIAPLLHSRLAILCGGPGSGKTHTARELIDALSKQKKMQIAIAAPTGKAALRLQEGLASTHKAKTLHALLKITKRKMRPSPLGADLVIVDEASMIDMSMMAHLLSALKEGSRLLLIGDPHQLPPIGLGSPFSDLVALKEHVIELKQCWRTDLQELITLAEAIKAGDEETVFSALQNSEALTWRSLPERIDMLFEKETLFQGSFCFLSPLRHGPFGSQAVNYCFAQHCTRQEVPIVVTENDYANDLANGELGVKIQGEVFFGNRRIPLPLLKAWEYAFCLSVHKSQGSEFDHVILLLPPGSEYFGKRLLYTAVTRARRHLEVWGDREVLKKCLLN